MAFHDIEFPVAVRSISATPSWPVDIIKLGGGGEQRVLLPTDSKREYDAVYSVISETAAQQVAEFLNARRGPLHSFKIYDVFLHKATAEAFGTGGGVGSVNQLIYDEGDAANSYIREIYLPKPGTVTIFAGATQKTEGVHYTLNYNGANGGKVTWLTSVSGLTLTWSGEFYIPVRFDTESLPDITAIAMIGNGKIVAQGPTIPLVEVDYPGEWV